MGPLPGIMSLSEEPHFINTALLMGSGERERAASCLPRLPLQSQHHRDLEMCTLHRFTMGMRTDKGHEGPFLARVTVEGELRRKGPAFRVACTFDFYCPPWREECIPI